MLGNAETRLDFVGVRAFGENIFAKIFFSASQCRKRKCHAAVWETGKGKVRMEKRERGRKREESRERDKK